MSDKKRILITGVKRSGTTFFANFLNAQKKFVVFADFLRSLFDVGSALKIDDINRSLSDREKNVLFSNLIAEGMMFNKTEFKSLKREDINSWSDLFEAAFEILAPASDNWLGVKKTDELHFLDLLLKNDYKIIYLIRDPRDVLLSSKNRFGTYNLFRIINIWKKSISTIDKYRNNKNFMAIRFEDIIQREKNTVKALNTFFKTDLDYDLEQATIRDNTEFIDNSSFGDISKMFDANAIYRWKQNIDSDEVIFASRYLSNEIDKLGYEGYKSAIRLYLPFFLKNAKYVSKKRTANLLRKIFD